MNNMKLVFFDIDGTLWDEKHFIPESTVRAIKELRKNGNKAFLCSGRARANIIAPELFEIGFDGVLAACGNHVEVDGRVLYENLLSQEQVKKIIEVTEAANMPVVLEGPKIHWISTKGFENDPYVDFLYESLGENAKYLNGYEEGMQLNKFSADVWEDTDYEMIKRELLPFMDVLEHEGTVIEMIPKGTSKATGIKWLCDYMQVPVEDTYALGDSINDIDMLAFVGHGISMGNGTEPAKRAAEYITTGLYEDGVYNALKHYGLI